MTSTKWIWKVISARFANNKSSFSSVPRFVNDAYGGNCSYDSCFPKPFHLEFNRKKIGDFVPVR